LTVVLYSGGVRLTIEGTNLDLVQSKQMIVTVKFFGVSRPGFTYTVSKLGSTSLKNKFLCRPI